MWIMIRISLVGEILIVFTHSNGSSIIESCKSHSHVFSLWCEPFLSPICSTPLHQVNPICTLHSLKHALASRSSYLIVTQVQCTYSIQKIYGWWCILPTGAPVINDLKFLDMPLKLETNNSFTRHLPWCSDLIHICMRIQIGYSRERVCSLKEYFFCSYNHDRILFNSDS